MRFRGRQHKAGRRESAAPLLLRLLLQPSIGRCAAASGQGSERKRAGRNRLDAYLDTRIQRCMGLS